jgi:hypothetical protein
MTLLVSITQTYKPFAISGRQKFLRRISPGKTLPGLSLCADLVANDIGYAVQNWGDDQHYYHY